MFKSIAIGFFLGIVASMIAPLGVEYLKLKFFTPDIKIEFEPNAPYVISTVRGVDETKEYFPVIELRFRINNRSNYHSALNSTVMLTALGHIEGNTFVPDKKFEPVKLNQYSYMPSNISPGMEVFAPFAQIAHPDFQKRFEAQLYSGDPSTPHFRFQVPHYPRWMSSHMPPGKHRFQITVYFENRLPAQQWFELQWPEKPAYDTILSTMDIKTYD